MSCIPPNPILDNRYYQIRGNTDFWQHKADHVFTVIAIIGFVLLLFAACMEAGIISAAPKVTNIFLGIGGGFFGIGALILIFRGCCSRS